jgi:hypothetical protein
MEHQVFAKVKYTASPPLMFGLILGRFYLQFASAQACRIAGFILDYVIIVFYEITVIFQWTVPRNVIITIIYFFQIQVVSPDRASCLRERNAPPKDANRDLCGQEGGRLL